MKNYLLKYVSSFLKKYIFVLFVASIFLIFSNIKSLSEENVFTINNVKVKGAFDLNFSRDKYINKAFLDSFRILMNKILLTRDLKKVSDIKIKEIKNLVSSFQILEESYSKNIYEANTKITFSEFKIKKYLSQKSISFSQPENITAVFFPVLYVNDETQNYDDNFFYERWSEIVVKNQLIKFILPLEDLEDISKISKMKNNIEDLDVNSLINKYDINNYVFALIDYNNENFNIHLKINFNNNIINKNITHTKKNIKKKADQEFVLKDLKLKIIDIWKEENLVNLLMPLSIRLKYEHRNLGELSKLKDIFYKVSIIDKYTLDEFNTISSYFKIYYYGNPKKLRTELSKFGYQLRNDQGFWQIYLNE